MMPEVDTKIQICSNSKQCKWFVITDCLIVAQLLMLTCPYQKCKSTMM